jgi:hypothetical protein
MNLLITSLSYISIAAAAAAVVVAAVVVVLIIHPRMSLGKNN